MKKLFFLLAMAFVSQSAFADKITVYGKNEGTTTTTNTTQYPDGTVVTNTTTTINCDNFYNSVCYTVETSGTFRGDKLTIGPSEQVILTGTLISYNASTNTVVFQQ